ncbi:FG-GAP repeat protein, partial [Salmonella enterica]|uniref:FG-GAP repeat protein n=1 Tax=Salmonella enterica TaxID=28901 RepID=UPI0019D5CDBC
MKKTSNSVTKVNVGNFSTMSYSSLFYKALYGDFNGDGKADIMAPQADKTSNWHLYISNGKNFSQ